MTTPADELRAAARLIRETAAGATPDRWQVASGETIALGVEQHSPGSYAYDVELAYVTTDTDRRSDLSHNPDVTVGSQAADAAWIALASPALAEPLADWLEGVATRHNLNPAGTYRYRCDWCAEPLWPCPDVRDALAVARAVNGSAR